jgi:hypothetical protein
MEVTHMTAIPLPAFVTYPGDPTAPSPIELLDVKLWSFPVPADLGTLQALCDKLIAQPSRGRVRFLALLPMVLMNVTEFPNAFFPVVRERGRARERELSFGIPGLYVRSTGGIPEIGFAMFMPFLFLDNPVAITTGREEYGFFKQHAAVTLPSDPGSSGFKVDIYGCKRFGADVFWDTVTLLDLRDIGVAAQTEIGLPWNSIADAAEGLSVALAGAAAGILAPLGVVIGEPLAALGLGKLSQIFLKQFRDIADGTRACYQAVTLTSYTVTRLHSAEPANRYAVILNALDSSPVAATLGIGPLTQLDFGLKVVLDMRLEAGRELWRA